MPHFLITWLVSALALLITAYFIPGIRIEGVGTAFVAAAILGFLNAIVKPLFIFFTLPLTIFTLGLFLLLVNPLMLLLAGNLTPKFRVEGFVPAILGSIGISVASWFLSQFLR